MKAKSVEELQIYQKALAAADEVSAILKRPCFRHDPRLRDQLSASSDAVPSLMSEGFGQSTDRQFAQLLYKSRGESKETRTHLRVAKGRDYISEGELKGLCETYNEIEKMTTGLFVTCSARIAGFAGNVGDCARNVGVCAGNLGNDR